MSTFNLHKNSTTTSKNIEEANKNNLLLSQQKKPQNELDAYFPSFSDIPLIKKANTKVIYYENNIDFITYNGEKFNIKLKNKIKKIFSLSDGILIKAEFPSDELNFFKKKFSEKKFFHSEKLIYYIINSHPLNSISIVNTKSEENLNIISFCNELPIFLNFSVKNFSIFCLLNKNSDDTYDFENQMSKIINGSDTKTSIFNNHDININTEDSNYYFHELIENFPLNNNNKNEDFFSSDCNSNFNFNSLEKNLQIFFIRNFSEKFSIFLIIFEKDKNTLNIFKLKISDKENPLEIKISEKKIFEKIKNFNFIKNFFKDFSHEYIVEKNFLMENIFKKKSDFFFDEENKKIKNLFIEHFLKEELLNYKKNESEIFFENLFFLDENNFLNIIENMQIIQKINLQNFFLLENFSIKNFLYSEKDENFIGIFEENLKKENEICLKFEIFFKFEELNQLKILEFLKILVNEFIEEKFFKDFFDNFFVDFENDVFDFNVIEDFFGGDDCGKKSFKEILFKIEMGLLKTFAKDFYLNLLKGVIAYIQYRKIGKENKSNKNNDNVNEDNVNDNVNEIDNDSEINFNFSTKKLNKNKTLKYFLEFFSFIFFDDFTTNEFNTNTNTNKDNNNNISIKQNQEEIKLDTKNLTKNKLLTELNKRKNNNNTKNHKKNKINFFSYENLIKKNPELLLIKIFLQKEKKYKIFFLEFCCSLFESQKIINFDLKNSNENFEEKKIKKNFENSEILYFFIMTNIFNLKFSEKIKFFDFLNFNYECNLQKTLKKKLKKNKKIFEAEEISEIFLYKNSENKFAGHLKPYISLMKFLTNFLNGFFSDKFSSIFREINELLIIIIIHFTQTESESKKNIVKNLMNNLLQIQPDFDFDCSNDNNNLIVNFNSAKNLNLMHYNEMSNKKEGNIFSNNNNNNVNNFYKFNTNTYKKFESSLFNTNNNIKTNNQNNLYSNLSPQKQKQKEVYQSNNEINNNNNNKTNPNITIRQSFSSNYNNIFNSDQKQKDSFVLENFNYNIQKFNNNNNNIIQELKKDQIPYILQTSNFYTQNQNNNSSKNSNTEYKYKTKFSLYNSNHKSAKNENANNKNKTLEISSKYSLNNNNNNSNNTNIIFLSNLPQNSEQNFNPENSIIFPNYFLTQIPLIFNNLFIISLIAAKITHEKIKKFHPILSFLFLEKISNIKINTNSYKILTDNNNALINQKILNMIGRFDMAKNLKSNLIASSENDKKEKKLNSDNGDLLKNLLNEEENYESENEYYFAYLKFNTDSRFFEALRLLNPHNTLKVNSDCLSENSHLNNPDMDPSRIENDKLNISYKNLIKQLSCIYGYGALNLNIIKNFPKDSLSIKSLNNNVIFSHDNSTLNIDYSSEHFVNYISLGNFNMNLSANNANNNTNKDKEFLKWFEFHNGVTQAMKISSESLKGNNTNNSFIRNWILFNKPNLKDPNERDKEKEKNYTNCTDENQHGGFLFGMGLLKALDNLSSTDIYQYMKYAHEAITIGILLGRAVSKISTMEEAMSRTNCLHLSYLIPSSLEISIPLNVQCASVFSLGLIYQSTCNRIMSEVMINQIGKKMHFEKNSFSQNSINMMESYNLCVGFSIGLINLGLGEISKIRNQDLKLEENMLKFINQGKKSENTVANKNDFNFNFDDNNEKSNKSKFEEFEINKNLTSFAGYSGLLLIYLKSNDKNIANKIKIPENIYELNSWKPINLYLAILTKNLIMFDEIEKTENWITNQIPFFIKFLYENPFEVIEKDLNYTSQINLLNFSLISTCYLFSLMAGVMSISFKFVGSNNKEAAGLIIEIIDKVRKVKSVKDINIKDNLKYFNNNKFYVNKATLDQCLCIAAYALGIIMSGSGDLSAFKTLRILRKRLDNESKHSIFGYQQSINHAIGFLFLGSGSLTFNNTKESIAYIFISTFPIFLNNPNDNDKYLQPLRHLYILSCVSKVLETRDIDTKKVIKTNIKIIYKNKKEEFVDTPVNLEDITQIDRIVINSSDYYQIKVHGKDLFSFNEKVDSMKNNIIYVKKKCNLSIDFYTEIRNLSFGSNYFEKEQIISICNVLQKDLNNLTNEKNGKFSNDNKKYLTEILLNELNNLLKQNLEINSNSNSNNFFSKIFIKLKNVKKNLLIIFADFLNKENFFTFINTIKFQKKLEKFVENFIKNNEKISTKKLIDLLMDWKILQKNLLEYDSKYFKSEYNLAINEIKNFLIFFIFNFENKNKIFKKFFGEMIPNNNNNNESNENSNDNSDNFLKINLILNFFVKENRENFEFEENLGEIFKEFFGVFYNFGSLYAYDNGIKRLKEEIKYLLKNFNSYFYENGIYDLDFNNEKENKKDEVFINLNMKSINENVIKGICDVYYNAIEKFKSKELVCFLFKIFEDLLNDLEMK